MAVFWKSFEIAFGPFRAWLIKFAFARQDLSDRRVGRPYPYFQDRYRYVDSMLTRCIFTRNRVDHLLGLHKVWEDSTHVPAAWEKRGGCCFAVEDLERGVDHSARFWDNAHKGGDSQLRVDTFFETFCRCVRMTCLYICGKEWRAPIQEAHPELVEGVSLEKALCSPEDAVTPWDARRHFWIDAHEKEKEAASSWSGIVYKQNYAGVTVLLV
ncbi:hypothetical protein IWX49DRAFT_550429 [Phyllosticta citricarpa]